MSNKMRTTTALLATALLLGNGASAFAASKKVSVTGSLEGGGGYTVLLMGRDSTARSTTAASNGKFSFGKLSASALRGASLQLISPEGRYAGPVVLKRKGSKVVTTLSGKLPEKSSKLNLKNVVIGEGFATAGGKLESKTYGKATVFADDNGKPLGAGELGLVEVTTLSSRGVGIRAEGAQADLDLDGIPDVFDADDDGDLVLDSADEDSEGADIPYTGLHLGFRDTVNNNVRSGLSDSVIDGVVSGENMFALTFFYSLPDESTVDGGHVVCSEDLSYCRPNSPTAYYGGVSESSSDFRDRAWSSLLTDAGYPRMELISVGGRPAVVASIQPRVGRSQFRPGDAYQVVLTRGGTTVTTRSLALAPYFVSVPALQSYNAGSGSVNVDYGSLSSDSGSIPGASPGDPVVLSSEGSLTVTFWRPQREALRTDESGYYDFGRLHYGLVIEQLQATCAGYYSALSSDLTETSDALGEGGSPLSQNGADLYPLTDSQSDRAALAGNTLSFTVNLKDCLSRAGGSAGSHRVVLTAAGEQVTGGQPSASQSLYVQIP